MECSCENRQVTWMNLVRCKSDWGKRGKTLNTKQKPEKPKVITEKSKNTQKTHRRDRVSEFKF